MLTIDIYYIVVIWFFILAVTNRDYLPSATILFLASLVNIIAVDYIGYTKGLTYIEGREVLIKFDSVVAFILVTVLYIDKNAWKQALILAFAVLCHCMISLNLTTDSSLVEEHTFLFYEYYDELIIMSALLQMVVSGDGMVHGLINGFRRFKVCYLWVYSYCLHYIQSHHLPFRQKKSEKRT